MRTIFLIVTVLILALVGGNTSAEAKNGSIVGSVSDVTKALIPGVQVTLTNLDTKTAIKTFTNDSGEYRLEAPPGMYELSAFMQGFDLASVPNIQIAANASQRMNMTLTIGNHVSGHVTLIR